MSLSPVVFGPPRPLDPSGATAKVSPTGDSSSPFREALREALSAGESQRAPAPEKEEALKGELRHRLFLGLMNALEGERPAAPPIPWRLSPYTPTNTQASNNRQADPPAAPADLEDLIQRASRRYGVDADLIRGVMKVESNFNPRATSPKGAMGLMQLMPQTARDLGVQDPYDPEENVMAGTRYLRHLLDRCGGDVEKALAAYNWGIGNVERGLAPMPRETRDYVERVVALAAPRRG